MVKQLIKQLVNVFDWLEEVWEGPRLRRIFGLLFVLIFLITLVVAELNRLGFWPAGLKFLAPADHFSAISFSFGALLIVEVISLVIVLAHSVAESVGKQFEIFSLIMIRNTFKEFADSLHNSEQLSEMISFAPIFNIVADAVGALLVFAALGIFYKMQHHRAITSDDNARKRFVAGKKLVALLLLGIFLFTACHQFIVSLDGNGYPFFDVFYTMLIFSDILIVLISLRYSDTYHVVFRNSGFAVVTMLLRIAMIAPPIWSAGGGVVTILFAIGLTYSYNLHENRQQTKYT